MNENIIAWIKSETEEFANGQYIAEVMSSPTEMYRHMEANVASALLHAMSFMHNEITGEPLPLDELSPAIASGLLFREGSYESIEFIRAIMDNYEKELERYKTIRSGEITKEMRLSAEIDAMDADEIAIAIAKAKGTQIYDYEWPCYYFERELYAITPDDRNTFTAEEIENDKDILWPVTCVGGYKDGETPILEPIIDYTGDIGQAMRLVAEMKADGFALSTRESIAKGDYTCSFHRQLPYETLVSGYSERLPIAIGKAYLKVLLFELNPDAIGRVFDETKSNDTDDVEEVVAD